jgi:LAO/AO transport system kinase
MKRRNGITELLEAFNAQRMGALARAISMVENGSGEFETLLSELHGRVGRAHRLGITGPPGAGKSTIVECLVQGYRARGSTVAVVAVDPTSAFTGGALLGDRVRMESVALDSGVFIRSMATRGAVGGVAITTREVCDVLDAYGFERIIIETVGVGQSELAVSQTADTAVLVLVPESGDGIQVLKAGVMEIADLYVINKADRPGAGRLHEEVELMLGIREGVALPAPTAHHHVSAVPVSEVQQPASHNSWKQPVLDTVAVRNEGISELIDASERHMAFLKKSGGLERMRRERLAKHTKDVVDRSLRQLVWSEAGGDALLSGELERVYAGELSPYELADNIVAGLSRGGKDG